MQRPRQQQEERKLDLVRKGFPKESKEFGRVERIWTGSGSDQGPS